jgi:hypothetical protein
VERCHLSAFTARTGINSRRFPAAGTPFWNQAGGIVAPVKIFLNVGNYHIALGNEDTTARMQLQFLNKGQIVQAGPRHSAAVDLHRVEQSNRSDLPGTARCPLNGAEDGLHHIVLKLERNAVLVMMPCPPHRLGVENAVIAQHNPVNGQLFSISDSPQMLNRSLYL